MNIKQLTRTSLAGLTLCLVSSAFGRPADAQTIVGATTSPEITVRPGFAIRGVVAKVDVKKGDPVKIGDPLMALDVSEEIATLQFYKARADTTRNVREAEENLRLKEIELKRTQEMASKGGANQFELQTAEAERNVAAIRVEQATFEGLVNQAQADSQAARVARMQITSPIDGIVRNVLYRAGENVDESRPTLEIVDLDPLKIDVKTVDTSIVLKLRVGQVLQVRYKSDERWRDAKIDFIDPQAESTAGTLTFRLEMPNPELQRAGLDVEVKLPESAPVSAAAN